MIPNKILLHPNWDEDLPQNIILQYGATNILDPIHREIILGYSPYLARHTEDIAKEVLKGYTFTNPMDKLVVIECFALGVTVDTAAIITFANGLRMAISRNYMTDVKWENRQITQFKFAFNGSTPTDFFTQYFPDTTKQNAVIFQPKQSPDELYGSSLLIREIQTALELNRLTWMEMVALKNGGTPPIVAIPAETNSTNQDDIFKHFKRGIEAPVSLLKIPTAIMSKPDFDLSKIIASTQKELNMQNFQIVHDHLLEDSPLPQMELSGKAESGALGGQAPKVDRQEAKDVYEDFRIYIDVLIQDFNKINGVNLIGRKRITEPIVKTTGTTQA